MEEANKLGVFHCDVNPWNVLCGSTQGCLVDWACSTAQRAPKLSRRGDFQAAELLQGDVGPHTDVSGASSDIFHATGPRLCVHSALAAAEAHQESRLGVDEDLLGFAQERNRGTHHGQPSAALPGSF